MRCAICFTPPAHDPLAVAAARWLRRDPFTGARVNWPIEGLVEKDHAFLTAAPRRMGFQGALKPTFRLDGQHDVACIDEALAKFCRRLSPLTVPVTRIALLGNYFALVPAQTAPALNELSADLVTVFDQYRSPLSETDMARGDIGRLNTQQFNNLLGWGHPHIFDQFRFHMTLTGPIDEIERDHVATVLDRHFGDLASAPLTIDTVALFIEPEPNAPLLVHAVHQLSHHQQRKTA